MPLRSSGAPTADPQINHTESLRLMKYPCMALFLVASVSAHAITGSDALDWHRTRTTQVSSTLLAYVRGALDGERAFEEVLRGRAADSSIYRSVWFELASKMYCPPPGSDPVQAYDIVVKWLQDNPDQRQLDLAIHVRVALRQAWRCSP